MKTRLADGSGMRSYKFLVRDVDRHGKVRIYFRRKGQPKIVLTAPPGSAEFDEQYRVAYERDITAHLDNGTGAAAEAAPGSMRWLCERYYELSAFKALNESTRRVRRRILDTLCAREHPETHERVGAARYATLLPRNIAKLRDEKAGTPEAANSYVKTLRQLFAWACDPEYGHATRNPARDVKLLSSNNPDGHRTWSEDDVARYEARHPVGTKARLMLDLLLYTGARISDVARLGPQMERNGKLVFAETKGAARLRKTHELPILPPLRASLAVAPIGQLVYLPTEFGKPHSIKGLGNWFARRCREAGLDVGLSAHGLRKLAAVRMAEAGASDKQLMAWYGWTSPKQAGHYTRRADQRRLEAGVAELLQPQDRGRRAGRGE